MKCGVCDLEGITTTYEDKPSGSKIKVCQLCHLKLTYQEKLHAHTGLHINLKDITQEDLEMADLI